MFTSAVMSASRTPGFNHSFSIFQNEASPNALEIFRHSISSGVFTTRAADMVGQALVVFSPARPNAAAALGS